MPRGSLVLISITVSSFVFKNIVFTSLVADKRIDKTHYGLAQAEQAVWPPGSADTVCPRPPLTLTF